MKGGGLPDFIVIGAQKCGTTSLYRYLTGCDGVVRPQSKEVHYFDVNYALGIDWYRSHFPRLRARRGRRITGEASPYYVFHPEAPARVREAVPSVRLIVMLRDPAERAVSHYHHEVARGREPLALPDALEREPERLRGEVERMAADPAYASFEHRHFSYLARGVYADQLERWCSLFAPEQLLVLHSERFFAAPREELRRTLDFLEVNSEPPPNLEPQNARDYPTASPAVEARLRRYFAPHNERLYGLLGRDFAWSSAPTGVEPASSRPSGVTLGRESGAARRGSNDSSFRRAWRND